MSAAETKEQGETWGEKYKKRVLIVREAKNESDKEHSKAAISEAVPH